MAAKEKKLEAQATKDNVPRRVGDSFTVRVDKVKVEKGELLELELEYPSQVATIRRIEPPADGNFELALNPLERGPVELRLAAVDERGTKRVLYRGKHTVK